MYDENYNAKSYNGINWNRKAILFYVKYILWGYVGCRVQYGGVKTLILVKFNSDKIFNASTCGDNCAKWFLRIAEKEDRTINLRHLMDFGDKPFTIRILNTNQLVHSMGELVPIAGELV